MTVQELIDELMKVSDKSIQVVTEKGDNNGCDTCGYGETYTQYGLSEVNDLEARVVLVFND